MDYQKMAAEAKNLDDLYTVVCDADDAGIDLAQINAPIFSDHNWDGCDSPMVVSWDNHYAIVVDENYVWMIPIDDLLLS